MNVHERDGLWDYMWSPMKTMPCRISSLIAVRRARLSLFWQGLNGLFVLINEIGGAVSPIDKAHEGAELHPQAFDQLDDDIRSGNFV